MGASSLSVAMIRAEQGAVTTKSAAFDASGSGEQLMVDLMAFLKNGNQDEQSAPKSIPNRMAENSLVVETLETLAVCNQCPNPFLNEGGKATVERTEVPGFLKDRLSHIERLIEAVLESSRTNIDSIDFVLLNGRLFGNKLGRSIVASCITGRAVVVLNPDRASCFGAALHASVLAGLQEIPCSHDTLTQPITIVCGQTAEVFVPSGTPLPTSAKISVNSSSVPVLTQSRVPIPLEANCVSILPWIAYSPAEGAEQHRVAVALDQHGVVSMCELNEVENGSG